MHGSDKHATYGHKSASSSTCFGRICHLVLSLFLVLVFIIVDVSYRGAAEFYLAYQSLPLLLPVPGEYIISRRPLCICLPFNLVKIRFLGSRHILCRHTQDLLSSRLFQENHHLASAFVEMYKQGQVGS
jgi:hypothetical protein